MVGKKYLSTTFDLDECVYMRQLSFLLLEEDKKNNRMVLVKSNKSNYFLILVCIVEIVKNSYYIITPMSDIRRQYFSDLLSSTKGDQRLINLLLFLVYIGVLFHLFYIIRGDQKKSFVYLFQFLLKMDLDDYVNKFYVRKDYALKLIKELKYRTRANLMSRIVYLFTLYSFYATGIWMSFKRCINITIIIFSVFPTAFFGIYGITNFYFLLSDIVSTYSIICGYLTARLDRLSYELRKSVESEHRTLNKRMLNNHNHQFNLVLKDFEISRVHFQRSLMTIMPAFLCTFAIFPYCLLISEKMYTHGLLPHFVLNTFFILFPLFISNEKFMNGVCIKRCDFKISIFVLQSLFFFIDTSIHPFDTLLFAVPK